MSTQQSCVLVIITLWLVALTIAPALADDSDWEFSGDVAAEIRWFPASPSWPGQSSAGLGGSLAVNLEARWRGANSRASIRPFLRWDSLDSERSHADLREAYWAYEGERWELLLGFDRVFWGVVESRHLVDIVNQTDAVEDPDLEQKLGQPMARLSLQRDWGVLDLFVMPWFRERTYPGIRGRLRPPLPVDTDSPRYESAARNHHTDLALRWSHYFGDVDIGLAAFHGTGREPKLVPTADASGIPASRLTPLYHQVSQLSLDLQYTREAWLWKAEAIVRDGLDDTFLAAVAGFEYTLFGIGDSDRDLGLLVEYLYDGRGPTEPATIYDDDLFLGARLSFNDAEDTNFLAGVVLDREEREWFLNVEAERRLGATTVLEGRLRLFKGGQRPNPLSAFDRDAYLQISLSRFF